MQNFALLQLVLAKFHFSCALVVHKQHFFSLSSRGWLSFELLSGSFFVLPCDTNWDWLEGRIVQLCHQCSVSLPRWVKTQFPEKFGPGEMTSAITSWVTDSQPWVPFSITAASSAVTRKMNRKQEIDLGNKKWPRYGVRWRSVAWSDNWRWVSRSKVTKSPLSHLLCPPATSHLVHRLSSRWRTFWLSDYFVLWWFTIIKGLGR